MGNTTAVYTAKRIARGVVIFAFIMTLLASCLSAEAHALGTPTGVKVGFSSDGTAIVVSWSEASDADEYCVYRKTGNGSWTKLGTTSKPSYTDKEVASCKSYKYKIEAIEKSGIFGWGGVKATKQSKESESIFYLKPVTGMTVEYDPIKNVMVVKWAKTSDATEYSVHRSLNGGKGVWYKTVSGLSLEDADISVKQTYGYAAKAQRGNDRGARSAFVTYDLTLNAPTGLKVASTVSNGKQGLKLTWNAVSGAKIYAVYRQVNGGEWTAAVINSGNGNTSYTDWNVESGKTYTYKVWAKKTATVASHVSGTVSGQFFAMPQNVKASYSYDTDNVKLRWSGVGGAEKYEVYYGDKLYSTVSATECYITPQHASKAATAKFSVKAVSGSVKSAAAAAECSIPAALGTPGNVKASYASPGKVKLTWGKVSGAAGYEISRGSETVATVSGTTYTDEAAQYGQTHNYRVRAVNGALKGRMSAMAECVMPPAAPTGVTASYDGTGDGVTVKWSALSGAEKYTIQHKTDSTDWANRKTVTGTSYTDDSPVVGTQNYYRVIAANATGTGPASAFAGVLVLKAPDGVRAVYDADKDIISITWNDNEPATGYNVYKDGKLFKSNIKETYCTDGIIVAGNESVYTVQALYDSAHPSKSRLSSPASVRIPWVKPPTDLMGSYTAENGVTLTWRTDILYDYVIYRDGREIGRTDKSTFSDKDVKPGASYSYQVKARHTLGTTVDYSELSEKCSVSILRAPTGLSAAYSDESGTITLTWKAVKNVTGYEIYRQKPGESKLTPVAGLADGTAYTETGLEEGEYRFAVKAKAGGTESPYTETVKAVVPEQLAHFKVTFDPCGGTMKVGSAARSVKENKPIGTLPDTERAGYAFSGWYNDKNKGSLYSAESTVTGNITLYARWTKNDAQGDSGIKESYATNITFTLKTASRIFKTPRNEIGNAVTDTKLPKGASGTATQIVKNEFGNYWYYAKIGDAYGYIYSSNCENYQLAPSAFSVSGHKELDKWKEIKKALVIDEKINANGCTIKKVTGSILQNGLVARNVESNDQTASVKTNSTQFSTKGTAINSKLSPMRMQSGIYEYVLDVDAAYKIADGKTVTEAEATGIRVLDDWFEVHGGSSDAYKISFDAAGGACAQKEKYVKKGSAIGDMPVPTHSSENFLGWFTPDGKEAAADMTVNSDLRLTAHWGTDAVYTVVFDPSGGVCTPASKRLAGNSAIGAMPVPTRAGYVFAGWFTGKTDGKELDDNTIVTRNMTVYAHWKNALPEKSGGGVAAAQTYDQATAIITYYLNQIGYFDENGNIKGNVYWNRWGKDSSKRSVMIKHADNGQYAEDVTHTRKCTGSGESHSGDNCKSNNFNSDRQCQGFADYMAYVVFKSGHCLGNWEKEGWTKVTGDAWSKYSDDKKAAFEVHPGDIIRYKTNKQHFVMVYKVDANGRITVIECNGNGACNIGITTIVHGSNGGQTYLYKEWSQDRVKEMLGGKWKNGCWVYKSPIKDDKCTITFEANGGTVTPGSKTIVMGAAVGTLPTPERRGYDFIGWYTEKDGGEEVLSTTTLANNGEENITLYAQWKINNDDTLENCKSFYDTYLDLTLRENTAVKSLPYAKNSGNKSETLATLDAGTVLRAVRIVENRYGNYWYEVTDGKRIGYVYADDCVKMQVPYDMMTGTADGIGSRIDYRSEIAMPGMVTAKLDLRSVLEAVLDLDSGTYSQARETTPQNAKTVVIGSDIKTELLSPGWYAVVAQGDMVYPVALDHSTLMWETYRREVIYREFSVGASVICEPNGGALNGSYSAQSFWVVQGLSDIPAPQAENKAFKGWYTAASGGEEVTDANIFDCTRIYAQWDEDYWTVRFDLNGGECDVTEKRVPCGSAIGTLPVPVRAGAEFAGWYTTLNGEVSVDESTVISGDVTYYARWQMTHTIPGPVIAGVDPGKYGVAVEVREIEDVYNYSMSVTNVSTGQSMGVSVTGTKLMLNGLSLCTDYTGTVAGHKDSVTVNGIKHVWTSEATPFSFTTLGGTIGPKADFTVDGSGLSFTGESYLYEYDYDIDDDNPAGFVDSAYEWSPKRLGITSVSFGGSAITSIPRAAFYNFTNLTSVALTPTIEGIGDRAFMGSGISAINIPAAVNQIGGAAFANCPNLTSISVDHANGMFTGIGGALYETHTNTLYAYPTGASGSAVIADGTTFIGAYAAYGASKLTDVTLPESLMGIGSKAFANCAALQSVTIPSGVTVIVDDAFAGCPASMTIYGYAGSAAESFAAAHGFAFADISAAGQSVSQLSAELSGKAGENAEWTLQPDGMLCITGSGRLFAAADYEAGAFPWLAYAQQITAVYIGDGIENLPPAAFAGCQALGYVRLPAAMLEIDASAFAGCTALAYIEMQPNGAFGAENGILYIINGGERTEYVVPAALGQTQDAPSDGEAPGDDGTGGAAEEPEITPPPVEEPADGGIDNAAAPAATPEPPPAAVESPAAAADAPAVDSPPPEETYDPSGA